MRAGGAPARFFAPTLPGIHQNIGSTTQEQAQGLLLPFNLNRKHNTTQYNTT
jgi:hypothetical protein